MTPSSPSFTVFPIYVKDDKLQKRIHRKEVLGKKCDEVLKIVEVKKSF